MGYICFAAGQRRKWRPTECLRLVFDQRGEDLSMKLLQQFCGSPRPGNLKYAPKIVCIKKIRILVVKYI